ncbi:MAG: glycosyltransferase [Chloroflexi bacterium]|nr:glycosyltransferase [Chloroflexota bacterium]
MNAAAAETATRLNAGGAERLVTDVLDSLEIAERAYHHLSFGAPLVTDLVRRARACAAPGDRVLLIGGSTLLIESLACLDYEFDVWHLPGTYLTEHAKRFVSRSIRLDSLPTARPEGDAYRLIIMPLLIEGFDTAAATDVMRALRGMLTHDGRALIATANQSRLDLRLAAIGGRPFMPDVEADAISLGWPSVRTMRVYHRDELITLSREAGMATRRCDSVTAQRPFMEMELLNVFAYAARKAAQLVKQAIPATRDVLVLECSPRVAYGIEVKTREDKPTVSVIVSAHLGGDRLNATLDSLVRQTYPADQYEIVVLDDGTATGTADVVADVALRAACSVRRVDVSDRGPHARNLAMADAPSDISAHTEDTCVLPEDWIESAVAWFDADTAVVSGPVFASDGSASRSLEVAATRPDPDEKAPPSEVMFPITNVFYRTAVALAAGGFDHAFAGRAGDPVLGWDAELAWRLRRLGWQARFREEVYQFRFFPPSAPGSGWARGHLRQAYELPQLMARVPEYAQRTLISRVFASRQTMYFDLAVAGGLFAVLRRRRVAVLLAVPWLGSVSSRVDMWPARNWPASARNVLGIAARQAVWLAGFIAGSMKARRIVL